MTAPKVTVFIDYQNVHTSGHETFCRPWDEMPACLVDPLKLAELLVSRRAPGGVLERVLVYRGRPDPRKQPAMTKYNDRHTRKWTDSDDRVRVKTRPLRYPNDWGQLDCFELPREKGIDVSLAVDLVQLGIERRYEVGIVVSRDTDLMPALEAMRELGGPHVEVATWTGTSRLRFDGGRPPLWCHDLSEEDFIAVRDTRVYTY